MLMCESGPVFPVAEQFSDSSKYFHQQLHLVALNYHLCSAPGQTCRYRKTNIWFGK